MSAPMDDPTMPDRPPIGALKAIERIKDLRSWEPVEMYRTIRDALQEPLRHSRLPGDVEPPFQ